MIEKKKEFAKIDNEIFKITTIKSKVNRDFKGIWIPKKIWLAKGLTWMEKLFLTEIDSLDNKEGCFASNKYFANFFNLSEHRCSQIINSLINKKYIKAEYIRKGKQIVKRVLNICQEGIKKMSRTPLENVKNPIDKNVKDINTKINNTINNNEFKNSFNSFLLSYFLQEEINNAIWNDKKQREIFWHKLVKRFKDIDDFNNFLKKAEKNEWIKKNGFPPSLLESQYSIIILHGNGKKKNKTYKERFEEIEKANPGMNSKTIREIIENEFIMKK